jgi:hypothetical protein
MKKYDEMKNALAKLNEIKGSTAKVLLDVQEKYRAELAKIKSNEDLSPAGKLKQKQALQKEFGEDFIRLARQLRNDYDNAATKAREAAEALLNEGAPKPSDKTVKTFERQFNALKTDLLFETRPKVALRKLQSFAEAQSDPYLASRVLDEFPTVAQSVLNTTSNAEKQKYKLALRDTLTTLRNKALNDEQKQAQEIYDVVGNEVGRDLFLPHSTQYNAIEEMFGREIAQASNQPYAYRLPDDDDNTEQIESDNEQSEPVVDDPYVKLIKQADELIKKLRTEQ